MSNLARIGDEVRARIDQTGPAVHAAPPSEQTREGLHAESRARDDFDNLVRPLELRSGARLNEPARRKCREAFNAYPGGVRLLASAALERGDQNPVGLFVRMIADRDHEVLEPEPGEFVGAGPAWRIRVTHEVDGRDEIIDERHEDLAACRRREAELRTQLQVFEVEVFRPSRTFNAADLTALANRLEDAGQ